MTCAELWLKWAAVIIDFLRVVFSWPVVAGGLIVWVLCRYKNEISEFLARVSDAEIFGVKIKTRQAVEGTKILMEDISQTEKKEGILTEKIERANADPEEVAKYQEELAIIRDKLTELKSLEATDEPQLTYYLYAVAKKIGRKILNSNDSTLVQRFFMLSAVDMPQNFFKVLHSGGIITENARLTEKGLTMLKAIALNFFCSQCGRTVLPGPFVQKVYDDQELCMTCREASGQKAATQEERLALWAENELSRRESTKMPQEK